MTLAERRAGNKPVVAWLGVLLVACTSIATPAFAATDSWWWKTYGIDALHSQGATGSGVTIAVIDDQIDPSLPVFSGRTLDVVQPSVCEGKSPVSNSADDGAVHGSTMAAMLIGNGTGAGGINGIAPDASVRFYGYGDQSAGSSCALSSGGGTPFSTALRKAVDEGAEIVTTSVAYTVNSDDVDAVAYALSRGVIVVAATSNPETLGGNTTKVLSGLNGVVAATGVDRDATLQRQDDGKPFVVPFTTVVAAGVDLPTVGSDGSWDTSGTATGSSLAAPLVAGMLALEAQKYPAATGNQLIQALIRTTDGRVKEPTFVADGLGFGAAWPATMLSVDPTTYPDENPLLAKNPQMGPTAEQIAAARGTTSSGAGTQDPSSEARGSGPSAGGVDLLHIAVVGVSVFAGLLLIAGLVVLAILVGRHRKKGSQR